MVPSTGARSISGEKSGPGCRYRSPGPTTLREVVRLLGLLFRGEDDLVPLYAPHHCPSRLRVLAMQSVRRLLAGPHGFFALPKRYRKVLAAVALDEEVNPFEPIQLPGLRQDLLLSNTDSFVYQLGWTLIGSYSCEHSTNPAPSSRFPGRAISGTST